MRQFVQLTPLSVPLLRLGLATRGNTHLKKDDVLLAFEHGVNYWNWCGHPDGMSQAIAELGRQRKQLAVAVQLQSRDAEESRRELEGFMDQLKTGWLDVVTFYYVESSEEWEEILSPGGAMEAVQRARQQGIVRMVGLTTHQRPLAATILHSRLLDLLMIRYNAAHRRAETEIFPVAEEFGTPLVVFTALRWKDLLKPTKEDPAGFTPPPAREWYRFALSHPSVSVALMAPNDRRELLDNLKLLNDWRAPSEEELSALREHGDRVKRIAGEFP
jgi:predicted aldo/keto reductase-like oxidoreductase